MSTKERRQEPRAESDDVRTRCYEQLRACARNKVINRYKDHPEWLLDERAHITIKGTLEELNCIFDVLNRYELSDKVTPK